MPVPSPPSDESGSAASGPLAPPRPADLGSGTLEYAVVDVFTDRTFAGNPLAVVFGGDELSAAQMHAVAVEFNLSETTFPVALTDGDRAAGADYRLRIFTPGGEIPFAGHPTLGTAWLLARDGLLAPGRRRQACGAGLIGVVVDQDPSVPVELTAPARDAARDLGPAQTAEVASLVGLTAEDAVGSAQLAGCGLSWIYLPTTAEALARARPTGRRVSETSIDVSGLRDPLDGVDVYAVEAPDADQQVRVRSRVFVPGYGIPEDPATGSAAAGLGLVLVATGEAVGEGWTSYRISQGEEMGRPSLLHGRVEAADGVALRSCVAGSVVLTSRGVMASPQR